MNLFCCRRFLDPHHYERLTVNGTHITSSSNALKTDSEKSTSTGNPVELDVTSMGQNVVVVKNGRRICGSGAAVATTAVHQNKAYFEVKVQSGGVWGVGLATRKANLNSTKFGQDKESWVLQEHSQVLHDGKVLFHLPVDASVQEGDIIGVTYDHIELQFYVNGQSLQIPVMGIRGAVYPLIYVDDNAILDVFFDNFSYPIPNGFSPLIIEKQIL